MSWVHWIEGCVVLVAVFGPTFAGARALRRRLVPGWSTEPATVADLVLMFSAVIVMSEVLGTVHLFRWYTLAIGGVLVGVTLRWLAQRLPEPMPAGVEPLTTRLGSRVEIGLAIVALVGLGAQTINSMVDLARRGLYDYDSLHYHLTIAAGFATTGSTTGVPVIGQDASAYYGANAELLHAIGLSGYRVEIASPLVNVAAIVIVLAAAAAIGALFERTAAAVAVAAALLSLPAFGTIGAGALSNDILAMGCFLACAALAAWWHRDPGSTRHLALLLAGLAGGLAVGTKLTVAVPLAALILAIGVAQRALRRSVNTMAVLAAGAAVTTGYWLVRNLVAVHNPVPELSIGIGSLRLPTIRFDQLDAASQSVLHYVTDRRVIRRYFLPGLDFAFGRAWLVLIALGAIAAVVLVVPRSRLWRLVGVAGLVGVVAYLATPTTAGGAEGFPFLFRYNLRYVGPVLLLLAVAAVGSPWLRRASGVWAGAFVVVQLVALQRRSTWAEPGARAATLVVAGAAAVAIAVLASRRVPRGSMRTAIALSVVAAVLIGGVGARHYVDTTRYGAPSTPRDRLLALGRTASGTTAVTGLALLASYYGPQLQGRVVYLAQVRAHHEVVLPPSCAFFRDTLQKDHADLVVILRTAEGTPLPSEAWAASIPGSQVVLANSAGVAYSLPKHSTGGCA